MMIVGLLLSVVIIGDDDGAIFDWAMSWVVSATIWVCAIGGVLLGGFVVTRDEVALLLNRFRPKPVEGPVDNVERSAGGV